MHIANGRLYHDFGVGGYTYYCSSTIDYLILKESDFSCIRNFRICNFNSFSDHAPLCFELNANQSYATIDEHNSEHVVTSNKWNNEKRDTFRSDIIAKLPLFNVLLNNIVTDSSDVEELVSHFARAISDVADPLYKKTTHSKGVHTTHSSNQDWFDGDCINALRVYKEALHNFNINQSHANRVELCNCKKGYKLIVRKKKNGYKMKQSFELRKLKNQNPKEF